MLPVLYDVKGVINLGRPRKPDEEKRVTLGINLKKKVYDRVAKEGKPKHVIEKMVNDKYADKKD